MSEFSRVAARARFGADSFIIAPQSEPASPACVVVLCGNLHRCVERNGVVISRGRVGQRSEGGADVGRRPSKLSVKSPAPLHRRENQGGLAPNCELSTVNCKLY